MRYLSIIVFFYLIYGQDLNVDGNMNVSGSINMENNQINNVGDPSNENDAVNLRTLSSSGMKPDRIYASQITNTNTYTVPSDKFWKLIINYDGSEYTYDGNNYWPGIVINGVTNRLWAGAGESINNDTKTFILMPGTIYSILFGITS